MRSKICPNILVMKVICDQACRSMPLMHSMLVVIRIASLLSKIMGISRVLKDYSHILCGGSGENFRFWSFCIDLVYRTRFPETKLQGFVYFDRTINSD